ncbi:MAG: hypothetical protein ACQKBV_10350 [Puniceicoccales bacterium]
MIMDNIPQLKDLSREEMLQLSEELRQEALVDFPIDTERDRAIAELLDQRWQDYLANPDSAQPWEDVRERIDKKFGFKASSASDA